MAKQTKRVKFILIEMMMLAVFFLSYEPLLQLVGKEIDVMQSTKLQQNVLIDVPRRRNVHMVLSMDFERVKWHSYI